MIDGVATWHTRAYPATPDPRLVSVTLASAGAVIVATALVVGLLPTLGNVLEPWRGQDCEPAGHRDSFNIISAYTTTATSDVAIVACVQNAVSGDVYEVVAPTIAPSEVRVGARGVEIFRRPKDGS